MTKNLYYTKLTRDGIENNVIDLAVITGFANLAVKCKPDFAPGNFCINEEQGYLYGLRREIDKDELMVKQLEKVMYSHIGGEYIQLEIRQALMEKEFRVNGISDDMQIRYNSIQKRKDELLRQGKLAYDVNSANKENVKSI